MTQIKVKCKFTTKQALTFKVTEKNGIAIFRKKSYVFHTKKEKTINLQNDVVN